MGVRVSPLAFGVQTDEVHCNEVQFVASAWRFLTSFEDGGACGSVALSAQFDAPSRARDTKRLAPFSAPLGTIVGTLAGTLRRCSNAASGPSVPVARSLWRPSLCLPVGTGGSASIAAIQRRPARDPLLHSLRKIPSKGQNVRSSMLGVSGLVGESRIRLVYRQRLRAFARTTVPFRTTGPRIPACHARLHVGIRNGISEWQSTVHRRSFSP